MEIRGFSIPQQPGAARIAEEQAKRWIAARHATRVLDQTVMETAAAYVLIVAIEDNAQPLVRRVSFG